MMLTGLARLSGFTPGDIDKLIGKLRLPQLKSCLKIKPHSLNHIAGWKATVKIKSESRHRHYKDIINIIRKSRLSPDAKRYALKAFSLLAEVEGRIHGVPKNKVTFHEIGALDSILDMTLSAALFDHIKPDVFICSPLPIGDGTVRCHHGILPLPAPATLALLKGVPVYGVSVRSETVTPTAIALLKAFGARFGDWPKFIPQTSAHIYGGRVIPGLSNGAVFTLGTIFKK